MKGNSKINQTTVFLMAFVLVVGFVGTGVLVHGADNTTSDISVTAQSINVDLYEMWVNTTGTNYKIIDNGGAATGETISEVTAYEINDIDVRVRVQADDIQNLDDVNLWLNETTNTGNIATDGDAQANFSATWGSTDFQSTSEQNFTASFAGDVAYFLRYGDWDIEANAYNTSLSASDVESPGFSVALHQIVENADSVSASGQPGANLQTNASDFNIGDPIINVTSNADWSLSAIEDAITLTGPGADITGADTYGNYSDTASATNLIAASTRTPNNLTASGSHFLVYEIDIPTGQEPGTYTDTITHNLNNEDG